MQREVEAENEAIDNAFDKLMENPEALPRLTHDKVLPLIKALNMELRFIKLREDQGSLDSVANSDYLLENIKRQLLKDKE